MSVRLGLVMAGGLAGCAGNPILGNVDTAVDDVVGPEIEHEAVADPRSFGQDVLIEASVTDRSGVQSVEVDYQQETEVAWKTRTLVGVSGDLYQGTIPSADVGSARMRYFVRAADDLDNSTCAPADCDVEPYEFPVVQ